MLIWTPDHAHRLTTLIGAATRIIIGTGNLGTGAVVQAIGARAKAGVPVSITTGCGGGTTRRHAVTWLRDDCGATVRVVDDRSGGLFHAKVYAFALPDGDRALVGSANLSGAGFGQNREVMVEVALAPGELEALAGRLSSAGPELTDLNLLPEMRATAVVLPETPARRVGLASVLTMDWPQYVLAIRQMDRWWARRGLNVLHGTPGWVDTLERVETRAAGPLRALSLEGRRTLVGFRGGDTTGPNVAFFGDFGGTPAKSFVYSPDHPDHAAAVDRIDTVRASVGSIGDALLLGQARTAFESLVGIHGIASGVASRLLFSVRPDIFVPVNDGNRVLLRRATGLRLRQQARRPVQVAEYASLLERIQAAPWFSAPPPSDGDELIIWRARAALLDIFVYQSE